MEELERRASLIGMTAPEKAKSLTLHDLFDQKFPAQDQFLADPAKFKVALCTRRAGKSYGIGKWLIAPLFESPGLKTAYFALTKDSAKEIMWDNVLKELNRKYELGANFRNSDRVMELPNGSMLALEGADASAAEMEKFLGRKYRRIAIDEGASFRQDLERIAMEILEPTLGDLDGEMAIIGTPGPVTAGFFYDLTKKDSTIKGWSRHRWSWQDNPYVRENIMRRIARQKEHNPDYETTPAFKRMYLAEWEVDDSLLVYKYDLKRTGKNWVPVLPSGNYFNVLGLDLGFEDSTSLSVLSFDPKTSENTYIRRVEKHQHKDLTFIGRLLQEYMHRYSFLFMVVDGASKQAVEELKNRWGIPLEAVDKQGKADFIDIMNDGYLRGSIKAVGEDCGPLEEEYGALIWDEKALREKRKRLEHPSCKNDACDSTLYAYRKCYAYLHQSSVVTIQKTEEEKIDEWIEREAHQGQNKPWWERLY